MNPLQNRIETDFTYHPPTPESITKFSELRNQARLLTHAINFFVPDSREKSLAITKIEEAVFWANAGIARNQDAGT